MKITIEGATTKDLAESLAALLFRHRWDDDEDTTLEQRVLKIVEEREEAEIGAAVTAAIRSFTEEKAREVVDDFIAKGVAETDSYGRITQTKSWRDFIISELVTTRYNGNNIAKVASECVHKLFEGQLKGLLDDVAKQVRAQVDEMVGAKIKDAVRKAVGV